MTYLVSHQHNGAPVTTAHETETAAEVEARRVSAGLPLGAAVVWWFVEDGAKGAGTHRMGGCGDAGGALAPVDTRGPARAAGSNEGEA